MALSHTEKQSLVCVQMNEYKHTNAPIVNGHHQCSTGHCTFFVLNGKKTCPKGFGHRRNEGSSTGSSTGSKPSIADNMFEAIKAAKSVRDAARGVPLEDQNEKKEFVAAQERQGNIK